MIRDVRPSAAATGTEAGAGDRPHRGDGARAPASGSTVIRREVVPPDRAASFSRSWETPGGSSASRWASASFGPVLPTVVHDFTAAWERGDEPAVEDYLRRLDPTDEQGAVDLIYRAFCLAEADGRAPESEAYIARFPRHAGPLRGLFRLHGACSPSLLNRLLGPPPSASASGSRGGDGPSTAMPEAGDEIGPYRLRRELGRGSFARVFLAEQSDLADRLVVVKIATRATREPWLLARARHAHIVEILSHAEVDDGAFQLISMPFWGGATLADVLAAPGTASDRVPSGSQGSGGASAAPRRASGRLRRRGRGRAPSTGADLLAALDAVGAPEYPTVHPARPAREILTPLPFDRAVAWVIARLAEALDHAAGRDVAHGDVKPSNILLSADGSPMLLDFNLARDATPVADRSGRPIDPGGTLAYMAPERLRALATAGSRRSSTADSAEGADGPATGGGQDDRAAHVADIYSLGMVLLEAISGRPPTEAAGPGADAANPASRPARLVSAATAYALARERPAPAIVGDFEAASGRPIAPALRVILGRCLDPDPAARYRRAMELAEDLDRWRTDRPLAFADEPFWTHALPRWFRVRRRKLAVASAWVLALGLAMTAVFLVSSNRILRQGSEKVAMEKLEREWDDPQSGTFLRRQRHPDPHLWAADDAEALELARRVLVEYGVIGPGDLAARGDWRARDDIRCLAAADRDDLDAWLMERGYRMAMAMAARPAATDDWRQARAILDRLDPGRSIRAFAPLRQRLDARLGPAGAAGPARTAPAWLDEHLLGFAAEGRPTADGEGDEDRRRAAVERALEHYRRALVSRPGAFWSHYRAATACFNLGRTSDAARHLERCLERRPGNAEVQAELARLLIDLGRYGEALSLCDRALERAPRHAELYRTRAYARARSRQSGGIDDDLRLFEMFSRVVPASYWGGPAAADGATDAGLLAAAFPGLAGDRPGPARAAGEFEPPAAFDPEEIAVRVDTANELRKAELFPLARAELDKILWMQNNHIPSRIWLAKQANEERRFDEARAHLRVVLEHPRLDDYLRSCPAAFDSLCIIARQFLKAGRLEDARSLAESARELAVAHRGAVGKVEYLSAQVYSAIAARQPDAVDQAAEHLYRAFVAHPDFREWYRHPNICFDPVRSELDAAMARMEDPAAVHGRLAARPSTRPGAGGR